MRVCGIGVGGLHIWRPFLEVSRRRLEAYAQAHSLAWVDDPSNQDVRFSRNFLRLDILPRLEARQAGVAAGLARTGRLCAEAADLLDDLADLDLAAMGAMEARQLSHAAALRLTSARLRNVLRRALEGAGALMPDEDRLMEAERQMRLDSAAGGLRLVLGSHALCVYREGWWIEPAGLPVPAAPRVWAGEPCLAWAGGHVAFRPAVGQGIGASMLRGARCEVRPREGGERLRPRPDGPGKSIKNLLQEAAIPPWRRRTLPLLWVDGRLAWVAGVGVDAAFRCPPGEPGMVPDWPVAT